MKKITILLHTIVIVTVIKVIMSQNTSNNIKCNSNQFINSNNNCQNCLPFCKSCINGNSCLECSEFFYIDIIDVNNSKCSYCGQGCVKCKSKSSCEECDANSFFTVLEEINGRYLTKCKQCDERFPNCSLCNFTTKKCLSCKENKKLNDEGECPVTISFRKKLAIAILVPIGFLILIVLFLYCFIKSKNKSKKKAIETENIKLFEQVSPKNNFKKKATLKYSQNNFESVNKIDSLQISNNKITNKSNDNDDKKNSSDNNIKANYKNSRISAKRFSLKDDDNNYKSGLGGSSKVNKKFNNNFPEIKELDHEENQEIKENKILVLDLKNDSNNLKEEFNINISEIEQKDEEIFTITNNIVPVINEIPKIGNKIAETSFSDGTNSIHQANNNDDDIKPNNQFNITSNFDAGSIGNATFDQNEIIIRQNN